MLSTLHISKYVLIDSLDIDFGTGLSIISGETGAGKSILLGALGLLMGNRADTADIAPGADKCVLEATFTQLNPKLAILFEENGLDFDADECIIRREISTKGKSRAFINDTPTAISTIRLLGDHLIDIHSQHKNLLLGDAGFQLTVIDLYANAENLISEYAAAYRYYLNICHELDRLVDTAAQSARETDYLQYQLNELTTAGLIPQEEEVLEEEERGLSHAQDIRSGLAMASVNLQPEEASPAEAIRRAQAALRGIRHYLPLAAEYADRLDTVRIEIEDIVSSIERLSDEINVNPEKLILVEARLDQLNSLMHKHSAPSSQALIEIRDNIDDRLEQINSDDERIDELKKQKETAYESLLLIAQEIHCIRSDAATELSAYLAEALRPLGIPHVRFEVCLDKLSEPNARGIDRAVFLFSANKHIPLEPVADIASGGEIARLMLCLKALIAGKRSLPTIIFDEVDTGVSGDIADRMGAIMQQMGRDMQVITITHLPQIAACGSEHYYVYKETYIDHTETKVRSLSESERIDEIARMQSGAKLTDISRAAAADLLLRNQNPQFDDQQR